MKKFNLIDVIPFLRFVIIVLCLIFAVTCCKTEEENIIKCKDNNPSWSPDGNYIAFYRNPEDVIIDDMGIKTSPFQCSFSEYNYRGDEQQKGIRILDLETTESEFLTDGWSPDWSPDGKEIVYVKDRDIYKINVETRVIKQLTTWGSCFFPDWSPNGKRIAFDTSHDDPGGANVIWLMDTNGTNQKDISIHGTGEWREPEWSPSADKLVHIRYLAGVTFREIFIMDSSGQNSVRLTNNQVDDYRPAWSPDGSKIAYVSERQGKINIYVIDTIGQNEVKLTDLDWATDPAWSPDGNRIVFSQWSEEANAYSLWIMNSDGSEKEQITFPDD